MSEGDDESSEMEEGSVYFDSMVISHEQSPEVPPYCPKNGMLGYSSGLAVIIVEHSAQALAACDNTFGR